ncbi:helix-turn-helix domain-containing protein [Streptococcus caviae]|uniref:helix-turn-helix domain-containing protein n=1 Tax=Streptococcus sp. 'caviae' TaxID=1915004 RepID=UPI00094B9501|nr:helix-turn-helix transcriptional regulator [Streptococcus sp. 'caviae']OLN82413.1 helix-turn-helix domain-containing protein [Streptococcus sp. 'caviae']
MNKIGDILRDARIEKKLSFDDVVDKTGIAPHYILAMELDQLKLLPEGKTNEYLEKYAQVVGLDPVSIIHGYRNQELSDDLILPSSVDEPASSSSADTAADKDEPETQSEEKSAETPQDLSIDLDVTQNISLTEETPQLEETEEDFEKTDTAVEKIPSRLSKYDYDEEPSRRFPWALILLVLLALAIVSYVGYIAYNQLHSDSDKTELTTSSKKKKTTDQTSTSTTAQSQTNIETDFAEGGNNVTLSNTNGKVEITFTLTGEEDSWVSATNTDAGESGTTLTASGKTYTVTLAEGSTTSMLTVAVLNGVDITINGQKLDTSNLINAGLTNINVTVQ